MSPEGKLRTTKVVPPPSGLPVYQRVDPREVSFFGRTNYVAPLEEKKFIFGIKEKDRARHMYIVGKGGAGKTKLLELLIRQDVAYGRGLAVLDPSGELYTNILDFIPEERIGDVILIDPTDAQYPASFNPLALLPGEESQVVVEHITEVLRRQFGYAWTPQLEYIVRFTLLALASDPGATMRSFIPMLSDESYRSDVLKSVRDPIVRRFWEHEYDTWQKEHGSTTVIPLMNKLGQAFSHPLLKGIFGQHENRIHFDEIVSSKKILLVNLAKSVLGEENANLLGGLVLAKIREAGMRQADYREEKRQPFYLYMDDFSEFIPETFGSFFAQSKQYGIAHILSHQHIGGIDRKVLSTMLGNVGTVIVFRVGGDDAAVLEKEMAPAVSAKDMLNLGRQQFYIKMTIDGDTDDAFSAETLGVLRPTHESYREQIVQFARRRYAMHREQVQKALAREPSVL